MQIRYSRGYDIYNHTISSALFDVDGIDLDHAYSWVVDPAGGFTLSNLTTGATQRFADLDPAEDGLFLDFSDNTGGVSFQGGAIGDILLGGSGDDVLVGGGGADDLQGGAGDDTLTVSGWSARVDGGTGFDTLLIDKGSSVIFDTGFATGIEQVIVSNGGQALFQNLDVSMGEIRSRSRADGSVTISGTAAEDRIVGGNGQDRLFGNGGDDTIVITAMPAHLIGGDGDDLLIIRGGGAFVMGDQHLSEIERIRVQDGSTLNMSALNYQPGDVRVSGGAGAAITGSNYADRITGGAGDDVLTGGYGGDRLSGGAGADTFVFRNQWEIGGAGDRDRIIGFSSVQGDRISLEGLNDFIGSPLQFIGDSVFSAAGTNELRATALGSKYVVEGDLNGDGLADLAFFVTTLDGPLTASDFIL